MNALALLKAQHAELARVVARLAVAPANERAGLVRKLAALYEAHATIEEQIFYPCFKTGLGALDRYADDHGEIRARIDAVGREVDDRRFRAEAERLAFVFTHHVFREEEAKLLPVVASALADDELEALGDEMLALYEELVTREPGSPAHAPI